jgi:hypothetical protein
LRTRRGDRGERQIPRVRWQASGFAGIWARRRIVVPRSRGAGFANALTALAALAAEDAAVRGLRLALRRTARRLNALDHVVLPQIAGEIHGIVTTLEEDDRDEAARRKVGSRNRVDSSSPPIG